MAAKIRWLIFCSLGLLVAFFSLLPLVGVLAGLWPSVSISWADIQTFYAYQGLVQSAVTSLGVAIFSSLLAFYLAFLVFSQLYQLKGLANFEKHLIPLLSLPHIAIAVGLVFIFSDGGVFFSQLGLPRKSLVTLIFAIVIKEVPFFLLILGAISRQLPIQAWLLQGRALGYQSVPAWWLLVFPKMLHQGRLALIAATAYTLSVVDLSMLVGPNVPELFAVSVYRWQSSFAAGDQTLAFLANVLLILLLAVAVGILYVHEKLLCNGLKLCAIKGRILSMAIWHRAATFWLPITALLSVLIILVFGLWSLGYGTVTAWSTLSFSLWQQEWWFASQALLDALYIALSSGLIGLLLAWSALEIQKYLNHYLPDYFWLLAIILPQLSMVMGWQVLHLNLQGQYHMGWVVCAHVPFTFAYAYLVLKGPFLSINPGYEWVAASFGYNKWQTCLHVRLSLLLPALTRAFAIVFSVSIAQYIPTLLIGAGRVSTITTESVAIATGSQQDLIAIYMLMQASLPFLVFFIATLFAWKLRASDGEANVRN
ncbi:ABC transporter permease [Paraglaciecola aestuariivivens]